MTRLLTAFLLLASTPLAAQTLSESMAECSAVYQNASQWDRDDEVADSLMQMSDRWADAAFSRAQIEGENISQEELLTKIDAKMLTWKDKGMRFFISQEFRDLSQHCTTFADYVRVEPKKRS